MRPIEFKQLIISRFKAGIRRSLHVESSPGVGKTQIPGQVAKELGVGYKVIHAPLLQPEDYGFPVISASRDNVSFVVSKEKFPLVGSDCEEKGILLIDELPQTDNAGQKILAQLVQEREIHGHKLKDGWMIISTGNRTSDRAGANRILSHLRNKITTVELEASLDDWCDWALKNDIKPEVIGYIRFKPDQLNLFNPQTEINPTPRAWSEGVSASLGVVDSKLEFAVFKGDVGEGAAAEFCAFLKTFRKLPSPDAIMLDPEGIKVPKDEPSVLYALCGALANRVTGDNFPIIMKYITRMPPEFTVLFVKDAIRRKPEISTTPSFVQWASTDGVKILT